MINLKILKIAENSLNIGLKNKYTHRSNIKNKICGDKISIELILRKNIIMSMRYETESCIFCQASASILSNEIKKTKINEFFELKEKFSNIFQSKDNNEKKIFKNFKIFFDKKYYNRKDCILLPFNAITKAIKNEKLH